MARRILPHAPSTAIATALLAMGEVVVDETLGELRVGDGATPGGLSPIAGLSKSTAAAGIGTTGGALQTVLNAKAETISNIGIDLDLFKMPGETDYALAADRACKFCKATGQTLRLRPKDYPGARIEVRGTFNVDGNGARVEYLGVGVTLLGGVGTGFNAVPGPWNFDADYATYCQGFNAATAGSTQITMTEDPAFPVGAYIFIAGEPAGNSSDNNGPNYIPRYFEFARVKAIAGRVITLMAPLKESYNSTRAIAWSTGMAVNCNIRGLTITTTDKDAYQYVVRSMVGGSITGITFEGNSAVGASTFTENVLCADWLILGAYGGVSCARGTVSVTFRNIQWRRRTGSAEQVCIFIEESLYEVVVDGMKADGGAFIIGSIQGQGPNGERPNTRRRVLVMNSRFDGRNGQNGQTLSPFQGGSSQGVDVIVKNCIFIGAATTPDAGSYPGISGTALCYHSVSMAGDLIKFDSDCVFVSTNGGASFKTGTAGQGTYTVSENAHFVNCNPPTSELTTRGRWIDITDQFDGSKYGTIGSPYAKPAMRKNGKSDLVLAGAITVIGTPTDGAVITQILPGFRPISNKLLILQGFNGDVAVNVPCILQTNGQLQVYHFNGATAISFDNINIPLDY